jgi:hypothetical protein
LLRPSKSVSFSSNCKTDWQKDFVCEGKMKSHRLAVPCVMLAPLIALSISLKTEARVRLAQANETPSADAGFTASPVSGTAPLAVGFRYEGSKKQPRVDFCDGSSSAMNPAPTCAICVPVYVASHIYVAAGTFTATFTADGQVAATIKITVARP